MKFDEISITDFEGLHVGQAEDKEGATGITVLYAPKGMPAGLDVRGGGPASRESELLKPLAAAQFIHAVVLSGGSAFGLGAANGVLRYLEEHDIGLDVGVAKVPLVCQSDIFDLNCGDAQCRPDAEMAYKACVNAEKGNYREGSYGAGCGATVGKLKGNDYAMKSGTGFYGVKVGDLMVGAVIVVNALGDVYDPDTGRKLAGTLAEDKASFADPVELMCARYEASKGMAANTTIGAVITNAKFDKSRLCKIAGMAHDGMARAIRPIHTSMDGDSLYALSLGEVEADPDTVGTLAALTTERAIGRAVKAAETAYGFKGLK